MRFVSVCLHVRADDDHDCHTDCIKYLFFCTSHDSCKILVCNSINYQRVGRLSIDGFQMSIKRPTSGGQTRVR